MSNSDLVNGANQLSCTLGESLKSKTTKIVS